jgi:hypothetical protein
VGGRGKATGSLFRHVSTLVLTTAAGAPGDELLFGAAEQ